MGRIRCSCLHSAPDRTGRHAPRAIRLLSARHTPLIAAAIAALLTPGLTWGQGAGTALQFAGDDDYVTVAQHDSLNLPGPYSIEMFLRPDGGFDPSATDYQGLLDKGDYQLFLDPNDGALRFVQPTAGEFAQELGNNFTDTVLAMVVFDADGAGPEPAALYLGGRFQRANTRASHIVKWDGAHWTPLGEGTDAPVNALAVFDDGTGPALYAGGEFTEAGGVAVHHIAKWDGDQWSSPAGGVNNAVHALSAFDDGRSTALYVGGEFTLADNGAVTAAGIARWTGTQWEAVSGGVNGDNATVYALETFDDGRGESLYVGGDFTSPGAYIAQWTGSQWQPVAGGVNDTVFALEVLNPGDGDALYVGGEFVVAGGSTANRMARWDGTSWTTLGDGFNGRVRTFAVYNGALYAGGHFTEADGVEARRIARWDGNTWVEVGGGVSGSGGGDVWEVFSLAAYRDELIVGGLFNRAGGLWVTYLGRWDDVQWRPSFAGPDSVVYAMTVYDGELYIGGAFSHIEGLTTNYIARWDGDTWRTVSSGMNQYVYGLATYDDGNGEALYAVGMFTTAGGQSARRIAKWDGQQWSALGEGSTNGLNYQAYAMAVFDDGRGPALYVGGFFTSAGGVWAERIARWDGVQWEHVGGPSSISGGECEVRALGTLDDGNGEALFVGGNFTTAGGNPASCVAKWTGTVWEAVGSGANDTVRDFASYDGDVFVCGAFTEVGGVMANRVARWNGSEWAAVSPGMDDIVRTFAVHNNELYAGGSFQLADGVPAKRLARWNGVRWNPVRGGVNDDVRVLELYDGDLFIGGRFSMADGWYSQAIARWHQPLRSIASARTTWNEEMVHVAITHDELDLRMYVNGVLEAEVPSTTLPGDTTITPLWVGRTSDAPVDEGAGEFFGGHIDELRIWNAAQSADDIRDNLNRKLIGDEPGLVAYYRMDEGTGQTMADSSPNTNAGTLLGPAWTTSTAPLGDAATWTVLADPLSLASSYGDSLEVADLSGAPPFAALVYVDDPPNHVELAPGLFAVYPRHYFEVWAPDGGSPTYTAIYHYDGHPDVTNESGLALAWRPSAVTPTWSDTEAALDVEADTLTSEGNTGGQYILGEAGYVLEMAVSPPASGSTTPPEGVPYSFPSGTEVFIAALQEPGFVFSHWEVSAGSTPVVSAECPTDATVTMDADKVVMAVFVAGYEIDVLWRGGFACPAAPQHECWSLEENWCPTVVPDNVPQSVYNVTLSGPDAVATLDISPTIQSLSLEDGATIEVNAALGPGVPARSLAVATPITNEGNLRAIDGKRLVLDSADIQQGPNGALVAEGAGSHIEINGRSVTGGKAVAVDGGQIRLLGSGYLYGVTIEGAVQAQAVVVPDGQTGVLGGAVANSTTIAVGEVGQSNPTFLMPDLLGATLTGSGRVLMATSQSRVGDFFGQVTNAVDHRIEGAGVLFGRIVNMGIIVANLPGQELVLIPMEPLANNGLIGASQGGTIRILGDIDVLPGKHQRSAGTLRTEAGGIIIENSMVIVDDIDVLPGAIDNGDLILDGAGLGGNHLYVTGGETRLQGGSEVTITGLVQLDPDTITNPQAIAWLTINEGMLTADQLDLAQGAQLTVDATVSVRDSVTFALVDESRWSWSAGAALVITGGVGLSDHDPAGYAVLEIGGFDLGTDPAGHVGDPAGFLDNFHLETLLIGPGAHVSLHDTRDNGNRGGTFGDAEALYVRHLEFADADGRLDLNGLHLYFETLNAPAGGEQLVDLLPTLGDLDCDGDIDFDDINAFVVALLGEEQYYAQYPDCNRLNADCDGDGDVDFDDINPFVALIGGN